ncbi:MAG: hypothetical protein KC646_11230 [Candidatus Cloacimonetes bacterium]|nr:hypothetical protein [Candidatus Cloacimonadota bacterium]
MIAYNLENRKLSVEFKSANFDQVFRQLILTENYTPFKAKSYNAYYPRTKKIPPLRKKRISLSKILNTNNYPAFSASYKNVEVYLILEKILRTMKFPCLLSNKIYGNITLHLDQVNSLEVLAYVMDAYQLTFLQLDGSCLIKPIPGTY